MTAKTFHIKNVTRYPMQDNHDTLVLKEGVNVIVGELNVGKTKWLQMIDFALGDTGKAENAFDQELAEKYERIALTLDVAGEEIKVERRWKEAGGKTKIFANDDGMTAKQFSEFMLGKLGIPLIHVPSGNPYADRTWPELSWRELFRHMYKQEIFWSDVAQKQPDVVRSACILHFLDVAASLYPAEYGQLVSKRKDKEKLEAQKEMFVAVMQKLAVDIVRQPEMSIAVTPGSIAEARQRLNDRLAEIDKARADALNKSDRESAAASPAYDAAKQRLELLHVELGQVENERNENSRRTSELLEYGRSLEAELARFARAISGADIFADLKVTHCPACDLEVPEHLHSPDRCPVCGQNRPAPGNDETAGRRRIEFEEKQVTEELIELRRLITELEQEARVLHRRIDELEHDIRDEKHVIIAGESLAVRAIPPELSLLDREAGQITAELQQLHRVERSLGTRDEMNAKIAELDEEIAALDADIKRLTPAINFEELDDLLGDRMNDYLNILNTDSLSRWKTGRVSVKLQRDRFEMFLDGQRWTVRAGGTANYIIQLAYHFALFSLTKDGRYNYPGFLIIDFPPHFAKADDLRDSENYLLGPFVTLCAKDEMKGAQVIIAGRAFDNLQGGNVIHL